MLILERLRGYFLLQGEDVVSGIRTPQELDAMKECMPEPYAELVENCKILERQYKEMMVEYTVQLLSSLLELSIWYRVMCPCLQIE